VTDRFIDWLRHGEPAQGGRFRGDREDPLTAEGWTQLRRMTDGDPGWTQVISAPARRCRAFAEVFAAEQDLPLVCRSDLAERGFGDWEGQRADELPLADLERLWTDPVGFTPPGAEPFLAFQARVRAAWNELCAEATPYPLVFTHGGVIRVILGEVLGLSAEALLRIEVPYACRTRLRLPDAGYPSLMTHGPC